jgi:HrpA-like RNA helicase
VAAAEVLGGLRPGTCGTRPSQVAPSTSTCIKTSLHSSVHTKKPFRLPDPLVLFQAFQQSRRSSQWCAAHCLNYRALLHAASIRDQLRATARRLAIPLSSSDRDSQPLLRAITAAFFPNAAQLLPGGDGSTYRTLHTGQQVKIHPGSALFRSAPPWVVYGTLSQSEDRLYMQDVAPTTQERLLEVAPHFFTKRKPALSHG